MCKIFVSGIISIKPLFLPTISLDIKLWLSIEQNNDLPHDFIIMTII